MGRKLTHGFFRSQTNVGEMTAQLRQHPRFNPLDQTNENIIEYSDLSLVEPIGIRKE